MIRLPLACVLAVLWLTATPSQAQAPSRQVRMVFWNVEWFPGTHPKATNVEAVKQISLVTRSLADLRPDVLGMEEILDADAAEIAMMRLPGFALHVCSQFYDENEELTFQQVVIGSRLTPIGGWWENWKKAEPTPTRGFAFAALQPSPGHVLLVYVVHLKSNRGDDKINTPMRQESAAQLLKHVESMEKAYSPMGQVTTVIGGDFNTSLDDPRFAGETTLRKLQEAGFQWSWKDVPLEKRITLPGAPSPNPSLPPYPDTCFDHAFVRGATVVSCEIGRIPTGASDHRPVVLTIELPEAENQSP